MTLIFSSILSPVIDGSGGNSSQHVEDYGLPTEPLLDGMVLCGLPSSLCWIVETAKPSVTLYFHLSAYQRGEPHPKGTSTALTKSYLFNRSSLSLAVRDHQARSHLWHGPGDYKTYTSLDWAELVIKGKILIQKSIQVPQRIKGDYYCHGC